MSNFAWVTLTTNDAYSLGALVLAHSLKRVGTAHQLAVLVTPTVSEAMRNRLQEVYNVVQEVNVLDSQDAANLALLARPELGVTFTKLHAWKLVQFEKCVFLDSDILVLQNADELFEREELSAAPDVSWPDCFNSGVFVYQPSEATFASLIDFALKNGSFDGGDQGLLNSYFSDWATKDINKHLPFTYNTTAFASYSYLPAFKQFRDKIKILHFAGKLKPWLLHFDSVSKTAFIPNEFQHAADLVQLWWNIFCDKVHQNLSDQMTHWPKLEFRNTTTWTENHNHTIDTTPNITNVTTHFSEQFFDDIRPYHDPWEDYYEKLEQNSNNNYSETSTTNPPSESYSQSTITIEQTDSNSNFTPGYVTSSHVHSESSPPAVFEHPTEMGLHQHYQGYHHEQQHQYEHHYDQPQTPYQSPPQIEDIYNDNVPQQQSTTIFIEKHSPPISAIPSPTITSQSDGQYHNQQATSCAIDSTIQHSVSVQDLDEALKQVLLDDVGCVTTNVETDFDSNSNSISISNSILCDDHDAPEAEQRLVSPQITSRSDKKITAAEAGLAGALASIRLGEPRTKEQEEYEASMRRQCWEVGNIDYSGRDSFDNIWKKISQTLQAKPVAPAKPSEEHLTSAQIQDGKIEYDPVTKIRTQYKHIEGGYEVITTIPQDNGTVKTQVKTYYDPKPVTEEELRKQQQEKKLRSKRTNEVVRIDKNTTMKIREIKGGYEEVYTIINDDGSRSTRIKTFYDPVPEGEDFPGDEEPEPQPKSKFNKVNKNEQENRLVEKRNNKLVSSNQNDDQEYNVKHESTVEETRKVIKKTEISGKKTIRKDSSQEENIKAITSKEKKKKSKKQAPPPPADFFQNDTTTVVAKNVSGGVEYTYSTTLESGKTITTSKTVYEEEETELDEEEIQQYKKHLKDAQKHRNITTTKKLRSESGTKKIVPSENPGDVTTVETIKIDGGTEYHYTTVTAEGIVKKAVKTVYDPIPVENPEGSTDEEEIIEEYEEEIIEPGEKVVKTIETTKSLPVRSEELVEKKSAGKKSSKLSRTDTQEEESRMVQKKNNQLMEINQKQSNVRKVEEEEHSTSRYNVRRESKVEETRSVTQKIKVSGGNF